MVLEALTIRSHAFEVEALATRYLTVLVIVLILALRLCLRALLLLLLAGDVRSIGLILRAISIHRRVALLTIHLRATCHTKLGNHATIPPLLRRLMHLRNSLHVLVMVLRIDMEWHLWHSLRWLRLLLRLLLARRRRTFSPSVHATWG